MWIHRAHRRSPYCVITIFAGVLNYRTGARGCCAGAARVVRPGACNDSNKLERNSACSRRIIGRCTIALQPVTVIAGVEVAR